MVRHLLSVDDLTTDELHHLLELAAKLKQSPGDYASRLAGRAVALIFEKPSTRTRVSFEVAVAQTGGHPLALASSELQLGRGETTEDTGRVLSREVIDGPHSVVWDQADNRLHTQKALLLWLLGAE